MCTTAAPVKLTRYPQSFRQPMHTHDAPHFSLVLSGAFEEHTGGRAEIVFSAGQLAHRPADMRHSGTFSPGGALILTCTFPSHANAISTPLWSQPLPSVHLRALLPLLLDADEEAGWDLLALAHDQTPRPKPDTWLTNVRDHLREEPASTNLSDLAAQSGRHRVHLGRAFLAAFGETPSAFRRRAMLDHALCAMTRGLSASAAAAEAGFADQSHFTRACRACWGVTPVRLMRGVSDVASVQYGTA